ncbi:MAG: DNA integrity scanning protein DisA nucleotide-binding domain protein, partial [Gloeomargaritaceae cyanobacterium C42_A2020_066]|nr:DNA integrity scanning protein DisA nucleotide-binding domain protein [Gloeomargaritaceae cyanobacterium C42_A2020_066]
MISEHLASTLRLGGLALGLPTHAGLDVLLGLGVLGLVLVWGQDARYGGLMRGWALLTLLTTLVWRLNLAWTGLILQTLLIGMTVVLANLYVGRIRRWIEAQERRLEPPLAVQATVMLGPAGRDDLIEAVKELSQRHIGALIVLDWSSSLDERLLPAAGVRLDAALSTELILTIFQRATPLHDGAIWIRDNRLL